MVKVPAFAELGKSCKDLLYGGREGTFQYNKVVSVATTASDGVEFAVKAVNRDNKLDMDLKTSYAKGSYSVVSSLSQAGKLNVAATYKELAPGLAVAVSGTVGDLESGKVAADYSVPHLTMKGSVSLTASPKVDLAATTGLEGVTAGGEASYDTAKSAVTKWALGLGYTASDYQGSLVLNDQQVLTAAYAHKVDPDTTVGAEVSRTLAGNGTTAFSAGLAKRLAGGALAKAKLGHDGGVSVLYEQELRPKTRLSLSGAFNALHLEQAPKWGFGYDLKY